jgi:hypothetical protein
MKRREFIAGFGRAAPQAIKAHFQERRRQILEVRWLPPDPNDRSRMMESGVGLEP